MAIFSMRYPSLISFITLFHLALHAEPPVVVGSGNVKSVHSSVQTIFYSPVLLRKKGALEASMSYAHSYLLKDFSTSYVAIGCGTALGSFNAGYERFGNEYLNLNRVDLGYSQAWGNLQLGFSFIYLNFNSITTNTGMVYSHCGVKFHTSKEMLLSFSAQNIEQSGLTIEEVRQPLQTIFLLGCRWQESKKLSLFAECEKELQLPLVVKLGGEFSLSQVFGLRLGVFKQEAILPTFGFWILCNQFQVDGGYKYDNRLGGSYSMSITYSLL